MREGAIFPENPIGFIWTLGWEDEDDHRQDEEFSSSCRVTGVSSLNLALPPPVCRAFFLVAGRGVAVISY